MKSRAWHKGLVSAVEARVENDPFWAEYVAKHRENGHGLHIAVFREPFLTYIMLGKKTVESRFSVRKLAPYGHVQTGDIVLLKKASGPVVGLCLVTYVWHYQLEPSTWNEIKELFSEALCATSPEFWEQRKLASFATLMRVERVRQLIPFDVAKRDRRGWVIIKKPEREDNRVCLW